MSDYKIILDTFEGPLALLMHLIEKDQIDIYDIPIARITEQYLEFLSNMEKFNIDIASEFLVMAATLLQIKSRMLLPKPVRADETSEDEDPRQELVDKLLEYRKIKQLASMLDEMKQKQERYFTRQMQILPTQYALPEGLKIDELIKAFLAVWESGSDDFAVIDREEISVQDKMQDILHLLHKLKGRLEFSQAIMRTGSRSEMIATFLALLELIRLKRITIYQQHNFAPIYMELKE
ncbi:segregation and condensation protein A [Lucifera butyrica]|uniref:segregation and condensation protein A n=1 Tax=Lucifera butyrica TaxID=1351585 RepID=UPI000F018DD8|nr:segregation/condensation protein A [Lucifera butyrica]